MSTATDGRQGIRLGKQGLKERDALVEGVFIEAGRVYGGLSVAELDEVVERLEAERDEAQRQFVLASLVRSKAVR